LSGLIVRPNGVQRALDTAPPIRSE
jgi:hypothetical protein